MVVNIAVAPLPVVGGASTWFYVPHNSMFLVFGDVTTGAAFFGPIRTSPDGDSQIINPPSDVGDGAVLLLPHGRSEQRSRPGSVNRVTHILSSVHLVPPARPQQQLVSQPASYRSSRRLLGQRSPDSTVTCHLNRNHHGSSGPLLVLILGSSWFSVGVPQT